MNTATDDIPRAPARHDLAVCYRIYPGVSRRPIFGFKEKFPLVRLNLETFREAAGDLRLKLWVLLDKCPPAYEALVRELFPGDDTEIVTLAGEGNEATFVRQVDLLSAQTASDLIYFAEDDYLYLPGALEQGVRFLRNHPEADFLTLYDHADHHRLRLHQHPRLEHREDGRRWRTIASTCLTFMGRREALAASADVFRTYQRKNSDLGLWLALTKIGVRNPWSLLRCLPDGPYVPYSHLLAWRHCARQILSGPARTLWAPDPGLATHMELTGLAPGVDWEQRFGARAKTLTEGS